MYLIPTSLPDTTDELRDSLTARSLKDTVAVPWLIIPVHILCVIAWVRNMGSLCFVLSGVIGYYVIVSVGRHSRSAQQIRKFFICDWK